MLTTRNYITSILIFRQYISILHFYIFIYLYTKFYSFTEFRQPYTLYIDNSFIFFLSNTITANIRSVTL